jgi:predicted Zn-dependent protease
MMLRTHRPGRINWKLIGLIVGVVVLLGAGAVVARYVRKQVLAERGLTKGQAACEKQQWAAAVENLHEYLVRYPDDPPVLKQYAEANLRVRPLEGKHLFAAINAYRRIMRLEPDDASVYKPLAALYSATGQASELGYVAEKRLEAAPDEAEARLWRARALVAQDKPDLLEEARRLLDNDDAGAPGLVRILEAKKAYGRPYAEACQLLAAMTMQDHPGKTAAEARTEALAWLSRAVENAGDSAIAYVARAAFLRETPADPDNPLAEMDEAKKKRLEAAKADLEQAEKRKPSSPEILIGLARELLLHGETDRAEAALDALEQVDEDKLLAEYELVDPVSLTMAEFTLRAVLLRQKEEPAKGAALAVRTLRRLANKNLFAQRERRYGALPVAVELLARSGPADGGEYVGSYTPTKGDPRDATARVVRGEGDAWLAFLTAGAGDEAVEVTLTGTAGADTIVLSGKTGDVAWQGTLEPGETLNAESGQGTFTLPYRRRLARAYLEEYDELGKTLSATPSAEQTAHLEAIVARAEGDHYGVIRALEPLQARGAIRAEDCFLLAEAYRNTNQGRLAGRSFKVLDAAFESPVIAKRSAREAMELQYWDAALKSAKRAEQLASDDLEARLLRIEAAVHLAEQQAADAARFQPLAGELQGLREEHPGNSQIRTLHAIVLANLGKAEEAARALEEVIRDTKEPDAGTLSAELALVMMYARQGELGKAIAVCDEACGRHSNVARPWEILGRLLIADDRYKEAVQRLDEAVGGFEGEEAKRSLGRDLASLQVVYGGVDGRKAGIERLKRLAAEDPNDVRSRSVLLDLPEVRTDRKLASELIAEIRKAQGDGGLEWQFHQAQVWITRRQWNKGDEITRYLSRCMEADPRWEAPALLMGWMHERLDRPDRAEAVYRNVLSANPAAARVADRLIALLGRQDRTDEAREVLSRVSGAMPGLAAAHGWRLNAGAGDTVQAIAELKQRAEADPNNAMARLSLARLTYMHTKDLDLANSYLDEAAKAAPAALAPTVLRVAMMRDAEKPEAEIRKVIDEKVRQIEQGAVDQPDRFGKADRFAAYLFRADYLAGQGETELAEEDYERLPNLELDGRGCQRLARFYSDNGRWDEAIATLEKGLKAYPENDTLKDRLARAYLARDGDGDRARADTILADLGSHVGATGLKALLLLQEGKGEAARPLLEQVVEQSPTMVDAHMALIGLAMNRGEPKEARGLAARALESNPGRLGLLLARADAERAMGDLAAAKQTIGEAAQRHPRHPDALGALVSVADETGDAQALQQARTRIDAAIEAFPASERLQLVKADALTAAGQRPKAIERLEAFRANQAEAGDLSAAVVLALAEMYRAAGDLDACRKRIEEAAGLAAPDHPAVLRQRILADAAAEDYDAVAGTVLAKDSKVEDPGLLFIAGQALHASESDAYRKAAKECYEKALAAAPRFVEAKLGLALLSYQSGDADRAIALYREVLESRPKHPQALNDLAWILQEKGKEQAYEEALDLANRGVAMSPENDNLRDTRGVILEKLGRLEDAKNDFVKLVQLRKDDPEAHAKALEHLNRVERQLGDTNTRSQSGAQ